jgi:ketosteroid isomerase-like protein
MSSENVEAVRRCVDAVNRGDVEAVLRLVSDDFVLIPIRAATEGEYRGHAGVRAFISDNAETFDVFEADYAELRDLGDRVLALGTIHVRGKGSGVELDFPTGGIVQFDGGKMISWRDFGDHGRALEAAGLAGGVDARAQRRESRSE